MERRRPSRFSFQAGLGFVTAALLVEILFIAQIGAQIAAPLPPTGVATPPLPDSASLPDSVVEQLIANRSEAITQEVASKFQFCIVDVEKDRNKAFNFTDAGTQFITACKETGSLASRLCGEEEIRLYFKSISIPNSYHPNRNCNASHWDLGCEPGWASSTLSSVSPGPDQVPERLANAQPCCSGFFCPRGLTCMIPCPLGAYCPLATFDPQTSQCLPYGYVQTYLMKGACGGADRWADVNSAGDLFCEEGKFCPSPTQSFNCTPKHYCRLGSTSQQKCFQFARSCSKENVQNQGVTLYGLFFIIVLSILLLVIYGCSDQVMSFRERRKAKTRKKAAKLAQEQASAYERWGIAQEVSRRARNLSTQLSRTFSCRRVNSDDVVKLHPKGRRRSDDIESSQSDEEVTSRNPLPAPPIAMAVRHPIAKGKDSESQIFKYAFKQIEKEKISKKMPEITLSPMGRPRPPIDLAFEDLTMVLKKTGKKILANVTGKLHAGKVTAIMGPSGAGKTTFLNAVAGKTASECKTTGRIYINGREGSIRAYRKIIGFVPQDDIVHGSLTVEENLTFSAKYRLPAGLAKRERVLVVERIISSLGLEGVRSSIVGTVEKRGISGGQRKRVNVGLEMVMEPSLLILDEPTSGLDSTSSAFVLQALRREAMVGVNVVVVLHQPSYGLFQMFDNVMFLAKGGRTVYLGPVAQVEAYFESLGVTVPERINPPDLYMDLLEGIVKPEGNPSFSPALLPLIWIQRKGYRVPEDLKALEASLPMQKKKMQQVRTFREEAWQEFKEPVVVWWDGIKTALFPIQDISGRKQPGFWQQCWLIFRRVAKQRFREAAIVAQDYIILFLAGTCVGVLANIKDQSLGASAYQYTIIALSLLCMISASRTFSSDKLQYWRESASGINRVAFFLAKDSVDHFNTLIKPLFYLSMFYFFNNPRSRFVDNYIITVAFIYCITGIAYIFAIVMQASTAQLSCVFFPVVSTLVATRPAATGILGALVKISYVRWALEAYIVSNAKRYYGVWLITRCGLLQKLGYDIHNFALCVAVLIGYGLVARVIALLCLFFSNRKKQK